MKKLFIGLATWVFMLGLVNIGNATTYNALTDFSTNSPTGIWSYGEGTTGSSFFPLLTVLNWGNDWANLDGWASSQGWVDSGLPVVLRRKVEGGSGSYFGSTIPNGLLIVCPAGNSTRSDVIIKWTAPATGVYDVSWTFARENNGYSDGINALVFKNSTKVYESHLGPNQLTTSQQTLSLTVGDVLSFGINDAAWGNGDSSGFNAIITPKTSPGGTPVPASGTMGLIVLGLAGLGVIYWRNKITA